MEVLALLRRWRRRHILCQCAHRFFFIQCSCRIFVNCIELYSMRNEEKKNDHRHRKTIKIWAQPSRRCLLLEFTVDCAVLYFFFYSSSSCCLRFYFFCRRPNIVMIAAHDVRKYTVNFPCHLILSLFRPCARSALYYAE